MCRLLSAGCLLLALLASSGALDVAASRLPSGPNVKLFPSSSSSGAPSVPSSSSSGASRPGTSAVPTSSSPSSSHAHTSGPHIGSSVGAATATIAPSATVAGSKTAWRAPGTFMSEAYDSYYPTKSGEQPQPAITDPVYGSVYPLELTSPHSIPQDNFEDPVIFQPSLLKATNDSNTQAYSVNNSANTALIDSIVTQISNIINGTSSSGLTLGGTNASRCARCVAALQVAKAVANLAPTALPPIMVALCQKFHHKGCSDYRATVLGASYTQILGLADPSSSDGQYICNTIDSTLCPVPPTPNLDLTGYFAKPKPANARAPKPSGNRERWLHMSDFHIDPRYTNGAEANCSSYLCCRPAAHTFNDSFPFPNGNLSVHVPAPRYGSFDCDTPQELAVQTLQAIKELQNVDKLAGVIYTGDLVSHDPSDQLSRSYLEYTETILYTLWKRVLGSVPWFVTLGNHDSQPEAFDAVHSWGDRATNFSYNYEHVAGLWKANGWAGGDVESSRAHYAAYSTKVQGKNLRIISMNSDFWYVGNAYMLVNTSNPDVSGQLRWITDELQKAEDNGERVWLMGHVLPGWDGSNAYKASSDLLYQIVDRYSPHVIAAMFFGHTHEDELSIVYSNNGTNISESTAVAAQWIAPSVTPLTHLNSGFRFYDVDMETFDIMDSYVYYSDVNTFASLDGQYAEGPQWQFEYSARTAYDPNSTWPADAPLNASFWHRVTENMEREPSLVQLWQTHQGKSSIRSPNCTSQACVDAKICYMRSGSAAIAQQNCVGTYASVQAPYN